MPELQTLTDSMRPADLGAAWLLTYLLHSTLLLGGAWLATRLLGRWRKPRRPLLAVQETLWRTALLGGLVTATLQLGLGWQPPLGSWQLDGPTGLQTSAETATAEGPVGSTVAVSETASAESFPASPVERTSPVSASGPAPQRSPGPASSGLRVPGADPAHPELGASFSKVLPASLSAALPLPRWTLLITGLWLLGAAALSGSLALSYRSFCRLIRNRSRLVGGDVRRLFDDLEPARAVGRPVTLSASSRVQSPLAKGVTRPEICLPVRVLSELSAQQQRSLLAHELGHLVRRDPVWLLVARSLESVLFLQPFNRIARRRLQEISELRADDWAVSATGNPLDLARCLTRVADWNLTPVPVPSMAERTGSGLTRRIHRLLQSREVEGPTGPRGLWLAAAALLLAVALAAPGVSAVAGSSEAPPPPPPSEAPPRPEAPEAPAAVEAPAAPEAPETAETAEAPEAPPAPPEWPTLWGPSPEVPPAPRAIEAPSPAPSRPGLSRPGLERPPRIAPIPRAPSPPAPSARPPRLAWMASPGPVPAPAPFPGAQGEEPGETFSPRDRSDELSREELEELEQDLAEVLEQALEPLETVHEETAELIAHQLEIELGSLDLGLEALDETLAVELEALEGLLEGDLVVDLPDQELSELRKALEAMNQELIANIQPQLELDLDLRIPEVEHLVRRSSEEAQRLAREAQRLAQDGLSEEDADRLREQARRLAEEMQPRREEMERLSAEAHRLAREAHERAAAESRELRERLREQQREQMEELRQKLEGLREQRSEERERRREELRQRLEAQRERMEALRQELRERQESRRDEMREEMQRRMESQRQELESQRQELRHRLDREREEHRLQMEEHRREMENEPGEEPEEEPEEEPGVQPAAA